MRRKKDETISDEAAKIINSTPERVPGKSVGRPKKYETRKGRTKAVVLSDAAAKILDEIRKVGDLNKTKFDFSAWVSRKVVQEFRKDKEVYLKEQIYELQAERDHKYNEYSNRIQALAITLNNMRDKKHQKTLEAFQFQKDNM